MVVNDLVSSFGPFVSWMFLPGFATTLVLRFFYSNRILTQPTTPAQADLHKKRIRTLVILAYLTYTIYASIYRRPINFYELLGVRPDSEIDTIRKSFRKLARIYHPDKIGGGLQNERFFIELRRAHDCLVEPVKRMAYDRFGEDVMNWTDAITVREFFVQGIQNSVAFYIINPVMFGFMHWMSSERIMNFWQFSILSLLFSLEMSLVLSPGRPFSFFILPQCITQQNVISALHTTYIALNLASSQLYNLLPVPKGEMSKWQNRSFDKDINEMKQDLQGFRLAMKRLEVHWRGVEVESSRALAFEPAPKASVQTVQDAASVAASSRNTSKERQPSPAEETYIHLLSKLIFRARMNSIPAMQSAQKRHRVESNLAESKAKEEVVPNASCSTEGGADIEAA
ncbi:hypothetical protein CBS101457_004157 [Exobasidium rhododendri]|nr:hypothetical protein CBS101457_004157 [Exobasidium rhododendri]